MDWVKFLRGPIGLVVGVAFVTTTASAQAKSFDPLFNPFHPPTGNVSCEFRAGGRAEDPVKSDYVLSYVDGEELVNQRLLDVGYDRKGTPVWLSMTADESDVPNNERPAKGQKWSVLVHGFLVGFANPDSSASGIHVPGVRPEETLSSMLRRGKPMPASLVKDAHGLANWLWKSKCGQESGQPAG